MTRLNLWALALIAGLGGMTFASCDCSGPRPPAKEGEGEGGEGEGAAEGEGEGSGPTTPPTHPIRTPDPGNPNNAELDSDCDGLSDAEEFSVVYARGLRTDPANYDSDGDGIADGIEAGRTAVIDPACAAAGGTWLDADPSTVTSPVFADTDGDCIHDGDEDHDKNGRVDPGETDPNALDSDHDGIPDGVEDANCSGTVDTGETDPTNVDTDGDGLDDGVEDANHNGVVDPGELDPRNRDSDGDGIPDGVDPDPFTPNPDADGDGIPDDIDPTPNNPDSDGDGLCDGPGNVPGVCVAGEDLNLNGIVDANETDPNRPDTDCDGLSDHDELVVFHTNPRVRDTDGDLITDGVEVGITAPVPNSNCANVPVDADPTTHTDPLKADTDGDGINDGTEDRNQDGALAAPVPGGQQETDPTKADTDGDGICDGPGNVAGAGGCSAGEDLNRNGRVDSGESDPRVADVDTDHDGLTDPVEALLGTDPNKADTDGDGLNDGAEVQRGTDPLHVDTDCDGITDGAEVALGTDPLKRDSDGDGILDGVEHGTHCRATGASPETDAVCLTGPVVCRPDADPSTTTDPTNADSDGDTVGDGAEDSNQNGGVDPGELDPNNGADVGPTDQQACALENLRQVQLITRPDQTADLILAVPLDFPGNAITDVHDAGGDSIGAMVFDPVDQVAGVALKIDLAGVNATTQLAGLEGAINAGAVGTVGSFTSQSFASWDSPGGNNAALGHLTWSDASGADTTAVSLNRLVGALAPGATGTLAAAGSTDTGPYNLEIEVLDRSATSILVVMSLASTSRAAVTERVGFKLDDMANGTALAQFGDTTGVQCDRFTVLAVPEVDFLMIIDNSGSMDNEQTAVANAGTQIGQQLANSNVSFRVGVITSDSEQLANDAAVWASCEQGQPGSCNGAGNGQKTFCPFTNDTVSVSACVNQLNTGGSGEELFFKPFACVIGKVVHGPGIDSALDTANGELGGSADGEMCGRNSDLSVRAPFAAAGTYPAAPTGFVMLPRSDTDATKLRVNAQLAVIFITDANEQSEGRYSRNNEGGTYPGDAIAIHSVPTWVDVFSNFDGNAAITPVLSKAFVGGLVCPNGGACTDEGGNYENPRFTTFLSSMGGIEAALPDNADPDNAAKIQADIAAILNAAIGQSSPYVLAKPPISATIKVSMTPGSTQGACNVNDVPRSRVNGFDYDGTTNSITFFGDCRPKLDNSSVGQPFSVSYQFWIEDSPNPDGDNNQCNCDPPFVCGPQGQCECPADCGVAGGLAAGQTCNAQCQPECLPDCGGCANGSVCDGNPASCACACPADCNTGGPLPANQVCDPATCQPTCAPGGCAGAPPGPGFVCGPDCTYICPADCGGQAIGPTQTCDRSTCTVTCSADCNATCGGFSTCNSDPAVCACQCVESASCAPGFVFNNDPAVCGCACDATALACPSTHTADLNDCRCECAPNCGSACSGATLCAESTCTCNPLGG